MRRASVCKWHSVVAQVFFCFPSSCLQLYMSAAVCHTFCVFLLVFATAKSALTLQQMHTSQVRQKRGIPLLIYPPTAPTRIQWIVGIGIPLEDLLYEAMTTGYVLKAEYFLPDTAQKLRTKSQLPLTARDMEKAANFEKYLASAADLGRPDSLTHVLQQNKKVLSSYRWSVYKILEGLAARMDPSGRDCVLKSICQAAETPFHHENGIFGELLHILLTPSSSVDELSEHADNEYFHAESLGRSGANCEQVFKECRKSLLDQITDVYTFKDLLLKRFG